MLLEELAQLAVRLATGAELDCPRCRMPAKLVAGDDLVLEQIELEVPDV